MLTKDDLNQIREVVHDEAAGQIKPVFEEIRREGKLIRSDLRTEFKNQLSILKAELRLEIRQAKENLRDEMKAMENRLLAGINCLAAFYELLDQRIEKLEKYPSFHLAA